MSGHSKWSTIKHKKALVDAKRGKIFNKIIREITVAVRIGGEDPSMNPSLRLAVDKAKSQNMPSQNIKRAIDKGKGVSGSANAMIRITYEGYGPKGVVFLVDVATDNRQKTQPELRTLFQKNNGSLEKMGSVAWMFDAKGFVSIPQSSVSESDLLDLMVECEAEDYEKEGDQFCILTSVSCFEALKEVLLAQKILPTECALLKKPKNTIEITDESLAKQVLKLEELLEDHEDVEAVYSNFVIVNDQ